MKRILVVDDEEMYRETIGAILRLTGHEVLVAENGERGIEMAQDQVPDLIVSDVMMGKPDGFEMLDRLRLDPATSLIPFVFMTGLSDRESMRRGMALGADDFITKPFTGEELLSAIDTRLKKRKESLEEAERKLSSLRSSISLSLPHEIRTPLHGILGFAKLIAEDADDLNPEEIASCGESILKSGERMKRLLENFLAFAQIEIVANDPRRVAYFRQSWLPDTSAVVRSIAIRRAEAAGRRSDLELCVAESSAAISIEHFAKICEELIDNAFKFSKAGGCVTVRSLSHGGEFVLVIEDQGRGMTQGQLSEVGAYVQFERKVYEQQGSGLGLAIAKRLSEIHGGRLELETSPGGRLTVKVHLPLKAEECSK